MQGRRLYSIPAIQNMSSFMSPEQHTAALMHKLAVASPFDPSCTYYLLLDQAACCSRAYFPVKGFSLHHHVRSPLAGDSSQQSRRRMGPLISVGSKTLPF